MASKCPAKDKDKPAADDRFMAETHAFFKVTIAAGSGAPSSFVATFSSIVRSLSTGSLSLSGKVRCALNTTKRHTDRLCKCLPLFKWERVESTRVKLLRGGAAHAVVVVLGCCCCCCRVGDGFGKTMDDIAASGEGIGVGKALVGPTKGEALGRATDEVKEVRDMVEGEDDGKLVDEEEEVEVILLTEAIFASDAANSPSKIRFLSAASARVMWGGKCGWRKGETEEEEEEEEEEWTNDDRESVSEWPSRIELVLADIGADAESISHRADVYSA
jgi:hypothetical protein